MKNKNPHLGSSFDDFLKEDGIYEEVQAAAIKKVISMRIKREMEKKKITQSDLAKKMRTSRAVVARLLNPKNTSLNLITLNKAVFALGNELEISFKKR